MSQNTVNQYQPGGMFFNAIAAGYGEAFANRVARAALSAPANFNWLDAGNQP